jgi:hypothetical protein
MSKFILNFCRGLGFVLIPMIFGLLVAASVEAEGPPGGTTVPLVCLVGAGCDTGNCAALFAPQCGSQLRCKGIAYPPPNPLPPFAAGCVDCTCHDKKTPGLCRCRLPGP